MHVVFFISVTVPVAVLVAYTFLVTPLACKAMFAPLIDTGAPLVPTDPAVLINSILLAVAPPVALIPVPPVAMLPAPAVAEVAPR